VFFLASSAYHRAESQNFAFRKQSWNDISQFNPQQKKPSNIHLMAFGFVVAPTGIEPASKV
jgi:hypothetical protein